MIDERLIAFLGVSVLLTVTPGSDMALVTKQVVRHGRALAMRTALGIVTGLVVWAMLAAAGVAAVLNASATAFMALKLAGGAYLVYLGLQSLWASRRSGSGADEPFAQTIKTPLTPRQAFRQGLLSNLLNPKVGVFYTTFLPQFVEPGRAAMLHLVFLATVHVFLGLAWLAWYVRLIAKADDLLRRPRIRRWLDRATGGVLVTLGLRLTTERR